MKKLITLLITLLVFTFGWSQNNGINYKAKISDNQGNTLVNQNVTLKFSIFSGVSGTNLVYQEQHTTSTNTNGIVIANIGKGQLLDGVFESIEWGNENHFLKTEIDTGSGYIEIGFTEFKAVPYALYALSSGTSDSSGLFYQSTNGTIISNVINQDFIIGSSSTEDTNDSNNDSRLFFDKSKAAFRVGRADGTQWNETNRGLYSFASGNNNTAKGLVSTAFGQNNTVLGNFATAFGQNNTIPTEGATSFITGIGNTASANYQFLTGFYNGIDPNVLFAVGNGTDDNNRLSVFTVDKNGIASSIASNIDIDNATDGALITKQYFKQNNGLSFVRNEDDTYGYRILDFEISQDVNYYGTLGHEAVDLSFQSYLSPENSGATGIGSFATGFNTTAAGNNAAAFNSRTLASHSFSSAFGYSTKTGRPNAMVLGTFNTGNQNAYFEIGNGYSDTNRSNAFMVELNGRAISYVTDSNIENGPDGTLITKSYLNNNLPVNEGLRFITENGTSGWRFNHAPLLFDDIGHLAVDLSHSTNSFTNSGGATGDFSLATNYETEASGNGSLATGYLTLADHDYSSAFGSSTSPARKNAMAIGQYNQGDSNALFEIGNGYSNHKNTAFKVHVNGDVYVDNLSGTGEARVKVTATGRLEREAVTSKYYSLGPGDFVSSSSSNSGQEIYTTGTRGTTSNHSLVASIHLPHNSTINSIRFYYKDSDTSGNLKFELIKVNLSVINNGSLDYSTVLSTTSDDNSSSKQISNLNIPISNLQDKYYFKIWPEYGVWEDLNFEVRPIIIEYTE